MLDYILYFFGAAIAGFLLFAVMYPDRLPTSLQPYARDFNKWRGNLTYDQVLRIASIFMTIANSKTLASLGGPLKKIRDLLLKISRFAYTVAGDWATITGTKGQ